MTSYGNFRQWLDQLDLRSYVGITIAAICVISMAVFGVIPSRSLLFVNAFLSGAVWSGCVFLLLIGGKRVDMALTCALALIAGGLTTSIPSIFYEHTPVDWGSTLSRLGVMILVGWAANSIFVKWKNEHGETA